ncbi:MAG: protein kinase [Planctomycetota bacterium]
MLLDRNGTVWVTDFGLAKTTTDDLTRSRELVGTLRYMGPERFNGQSDIRSDIYSLGLTLYELLTFVPAYSTRDRAELIRRITLSQPTPPRKLHSAIPKDLETVVLKSIEKDPASRYQNAAEMAEDLRRFLVGKPIVARRTSLRERTVMWSRRNPLAACLTAGLAALLLLMTVGYTIHVRTLRNMLTQTETAQRNERLANEQSEWRLLESLRAQAQSVRATRTPGRRTRSFAAIREASQILAKNNVHGREEIVLDLRNQAIASMAFVDVNEMEHWSAHDDLVRANNPRWDFDQSASAYVGSGPKGDIFVRSLIDQSLIAQIPSGVEYQNSAYRPHLSVSPSSRFVAVFQADARHNTFVQLVETRSGKTVFPSPVPSVGAPHWKPLRFDPVRDLLYFFANDGLRCVDCETGRVKSYQGVESGPHMDLSPDGKLIAVVEENASNIAIYSTENGEFARRLKCPALAYDIKWSMDGRLIAVAARDRHFYVWSAEQDGTEPISICRGHTATVRTLAFSPTGMLASSSWDQTTRLWNPLLGKQHVRLDRFASLRFGEDGRTLGYAHAGNETGRYEVIESEHCLTLAGQNSQSGSNVESVAFSPDSKWIAISSYEDGIRIWRTSDGENVDSKRPYEAAKSVAFHQEGTRLLSSGRGHVYDWEFCVEDEDARIQKPQDLLELSSGRMTYFAMSEDAIVAQQRDGLATVFELESGEPIVDLPSPDWMNDFTISPDGQLVAFGTWGTDTMRVYNSRSGELVFAYEQRLLGSAPKFSPDGKWLALCLDGEVELFRVSDWTCQNKLQRDKPGYPDCAFSQDMKWIAMSDLHDVKLYRFPSLQLVAEFTDPFQTQLTAGHPEAPALAFSPDGTMLAIGTYRDSTLLWKLDKVRSTLRELGLDWDDE